MLQALSLGFLVMATCSALFLVLQPVGMEAQWVLAQACLLAMLAIKLLGLRGYWRHLFYALGALLVLRYLYWRTTATLPSVSDLQDFVPGLIVYTAEVFCIVMLGLSLFVIARPINRSRAPAVSPAEAPTVDVFVPSYNEDAGLLAITLSAAKAMDYPRDKLTIYLLDDGGTDGKVESHNPAISQAALRRREELQRLCHDLGVRYLTRERNVHAKAGNLSNGLLYSQGELVVVFDADHAPEKGFLRETVGFFQEDPKLFLVQTPHFFINPDPIEKNLSTFERMPSENEMFYHMIQKGLDKWNAAFFCGSAAVLRRMALEQAGGFAGTSITEDCETALELHARGWRSLYVDKPLIAGLQPETFSSFIGQRTRWCTGMLQILLMKNPAFKRGLSVAQRICYISTCMFWLFPIPRMVFIFAPLLYIFLDLKIYNATVEEFGAYTLTYLFAALLLQSYSYNRFRWPWVSEIYEYVQSVYLLPAIMGVIKNPRRPTFNVTAKGGATDEDHLSGLAWPYFLIFAILFAGAVIVIYRLQYEPHAVGLLVIVGLWNLLNLIMAGLALGAVSERRERRKAHRVPIGGSGILQVQDTVFPVRLADISQSGLLVQAHGPGTIRPQAAATLTITAIGQRKDCISLPVVVANLRPEGENRLVGLGFARLSAVEYGAVAELMYGDLSALLRGRQARQRGKSLILGTAQVLMWGLRQTLRGIYFGLFRRGQTLRPSAATS
ncbi:UDP-forming cellulose synthase catalytic subunit [Microvirga roseola]|uniref:UDP-forming cellulose synthase catalytic subunit n=1 Tax=Microvirga roseola TaxID=2883126 RepID=UPI0022A888CD|nr:UDP-forming cellulose synthase catalytic subunit [Microvirga roseola]